MRWSRSPLAGVTNASPVFSVASVDGRTPWFKTRQTRPGTDDAGTGDTDTTIDLHESTAAGIRLLST